MFAGILSDSHDHLVNLRKAVSALEERGAQVLLHAGDFIAPFAVKELLKSSVPVHAVFGNNDGERQGIQAIFPGVKAGPMTIELDGRKVVMDHYPHVEERSRPERPDVVIFGHTHEVVIKPGPPLVINPGECGGWLTGRPTCALLDTATLQVEIIEL